MPKPAMWDALTADEQFLVGQLRSGTRRPHSLWRYAFGVCDGKPEGDQVERFRHAAQRLALVCEIAQEMEASQ